MTLFFDSVEKSHGGHALCLRSDVGALFCRCITCGVGWPKKVSIYLPLRSGILPSILITRRLAQIRKVGLSNPKRTQDLKVRPRIPLPLRQRSSDGWS